MAIKCPNKNSPIWKDYVEVLGEDGAYVAYITMDDNLIDFQKTKIYNDLVSVMSKENAYKTLISGRKEIPVFKDKVQFQKAFDNFVAKHSPEVTNLQLESRLQEPVETSLPTSMSESFRKDMVDGIFSVFADIRDLTIENGEEITSNELLNRVRNYFLLNAYVKYEDVISEDPNKEPEVKRNSIPYNKIHKVRKLEILRRLDSDKFQEQLDILDWGFEPSDTAIRNLPIAEQEFIDEIHNTYLDVYYHWDVNNNVEFDNFDVNGWKEVFTDSLSEYGYKYSETEMVVGSDDAQERIHNRSAIEENMSDKLSQRVKHFLTSINDGGFTRLGFPKKVSSEKVYKDILQHTHSLRSADAMIKRLKELEPYKPYLVNVIDKLEKADASFLAEFYSNFRQSYTPLAIIKKYGKDINFFFANRNKLETAIVDSWMAEAFSSPNVFANNIYFTDIVDGKEVLTVNEDRAEAAKNHYVSLIEQLFDRNNTELTSSMIDDFAGLLNNLSLFTSENLQEYLPRHFETGVVINKSLYQGKELMQKYVFGNVDSGVTSIEKLLSHIYDGVFSRNRGQFREDLTLKQQPENFFQPTKNRGLLKELAKIQADFSTEIVQSFRNADKKSVFPYNMPTELSDVIDNIKSESYFDKGFYQDEFFNPLGKHDPNGRHLSPYIKLLSNSRVNEAFQFSKFDAFTESKDQTETFRDLGELKGEIIRINAFTNGGDGIFSWFAMPIQSDRDFLPFIQLPRVQSWKNFGINKSLGQIVETELLSQIAKYQQAEKVIESTNVSEQLPDFHTKGKNALKPTGLFEGLDMGWLTVENNEGKQIPIHDINLLDYVNNTMEGLSKKDVQAVFKQYADSLNDFVQTKAKERYDIWMKEQVIPNENGKFLNEFGAVVESDLDSGHPFGSKLEGFGSLLGLAKDYTLNNLIAKNELTKIFYSNRDFFASYDKFIKRAGLLTTPGKKGTIQGDIAKDPSWGLPEKTNEIIIKDVYNTKDETSLYKFLKAKSKQKGYEHIAGWVENYNAGQSNKSDAQGYMSIDGYRAFSQAFEQWTPMHEEAYMNYKTKDENGKFGKFIAKDGTVPKINPIKPSVFGLMPYVKNGITTMVPISIKNSYMVLLREFTQENGVPLNAFDNLRKRMEKEGEYNIEGLQEVHWANTESSHKVYQHSLADVRTDNLAEAYVHQIPSELLRIPQIKPEKKSKKILLASQLLRLITTLPPNFNMNVEYNVGGQKMSRDQWEDAYHSTIGEMIQRSISELRSELGFSDSFVNQATPDQVLQIHKTLRKMLIEQAQESNTPLSNNQIKAFDIEFTGNTYRYKTPLAFPAFSHKNEQVISSLFRNRLIQQKIQGKQVVQVAELGNVEIGGIEQNLKFITVSGDKVSEAIIDDISVAEIAVSADVAKMLNLKEGDDLSNISEEVKTIIGYRIPTSGKNLALTFRIKRILPENHNATVMVPGRITTQQGSDFDIDTLFLYVPHTEVKNGKVRKLKYIDVDTTKDIELEKAFQELYGIDTNELNDLKENTDLSLDQKIEELSDKTLYDIVEKIQTSKRDVERQEAIELIQSSDEITSFNDIIDLFPTLSDFQIQYKNRPSIELNDRKRLENRTIDLIQAVLTNPEHLIEHVEPLEGELLFDLVKDKIEQLNPNDPTAELKMQVRNRDGKAGIGIYSNALMGYSTLQRMNINLSKDFEIILKGGITQDISEVAPILDFEGNSVEGNFRAHQVAAIDNANEPIMVPLNDNVVTSSSTIAMLMLGFSAKMAYQVRTHPAIVRLVEIYENESAKPYQISEIASRIAPDHVKAKKTDILNFNDINGMSNEAIISNFLKLHNLGGNIVKINNIITPNRISDMSSAAALSEYQQQVSELNKRGTKIVSLDIGKDETFVQALDRQYPLNKAYRDSIQETIDYYSMFFPYFSEGIKTLKNELVNVAGRDLPKEIHQAFHNFLFSTMITNSEQGGNFESEYVKKLLTNPQENIVQRVLDLKQTDKQFAKNPFISALDKNRNYVKDLIKTFDFNFAVDYSKNQVDLVSDGFLQLFNNPKYKQIMTDIVNYSILTTGFTPSPIAFINIIPVEVWNELGYSNSFYKQLDNITSLENVEDYTNLAQEFIYHNVQTKQFLPVVDLSEFGKSRKTLNITTEIAKEKGLTGEGGIIKYFKSYSKSTNQFELYVFQGFENRGKDLYVIYEMSAQKGDTYLVESIIKETGRNKQAEESIVPSNHERVFVTPQGQKVKRRLSLLTPTKLDVGHDQLQSQLNDAPKQTRLKETFQNADIDVSVRVDNTIEGLGKLEIVDGKATIILRDKNLRAEDTEIHEFGHLYIELLGVDSKLIQEGINQLRDTPLWNEIAELYNDLSERNLGVEVLATAIGQEGANHLNLPWWKAWWNRMLNKLKELFGIERNIAQQLAQEMLTNDLRPINTSKFIYDRTFHHRDRRKFKKSRESLENVIISLDSQIRQIQQTLIDPTKTTLQKENLRSSLQNMLKEKIDIQEQVSGLKDFVEIANRDMAHLSNIIDTTLRGEKVENLMNKAGALIKLVDEYSILDHIKEDTKDLLKANNEQTWDLLNKTIELKDYAERRFTEVIIPKMASELRAEVHPDILAELDKMFAEIDKGNIPNIRSVKKHPRYKAIKANKDLSETEKQSEINELAKQLLEKRVPGQQQLEEMLREAQKGDRYALWMIDPVIYSDDQAIQLFVKMIKNKLQDARVEAVNHRDEINKAYEKFISETGLNSWNQEENHKKIIQQVEYSTMDKHGNRIRIKRDSFIQQYDIDRYHKSKYNFYDRIKKDYNKPDNAEEVVVWQEQNPEAFKAYKQAEKRWYQENTQPVANWIEQRDNNWDKLFTIENEINTLVTEEMLDNVENEDKLNGLQRDKDTILSWFEANFVDWSGDASKPIVTKNKLSRPSTGEKGTVDYTNKQYEWLNQPQNKAYKDYHDALQSKFQELQDVYGKEHFDKNKWDDYSYYLPSVRKGSMDRLIENGFMDSVNEFKESFDIFDTDDVYGQSLSRNKQIPIYYINAVDTNDISKNLASSMTLFAKQASEFRQLSEMVGHTYVMRNILENRNIPEADQYGNSMLDYVSKKAGYERKAEKNIAPNQTRQFKQWDSWVDNVFFGIKDEAAYVGNSNIELNKVMQKMNTFAAFNVFPFNFLQGISNVLIGNTYLIEEAIGNEHFSSKNYAVAQKNFTAATPGLLFDIGLNAPKSKLGQLLEKFDVQEGMTMKNLASNVFDNRLKNMTTTEQAMFLQRSGELQMAVTPFLAIMDSIKVESQGKEMSLYDAYEIKQGGKIGLKEGVTLTNEQQKDLTNRINAINRSLQGVYDNFNSNWLKKRWYGKAMLLFRSWVLPTYRRFWGYNDGDFRLDHEMGSVREGIYISGFKWLYRLMASPDKFSTNSYTNMSTFEQRNVKKFVTHMLTVAMTLATIAVLKPDEDEEIDKASYYGLYYSYRLRSELMIFLRPFSEGQKLLRSPAANTMMLTKGTRLLTSLGSIPHDLIVDGELDSYERRIGVKEKGDSKLYWRLRDLFPVINNIDKARSPEEQYKWYTGIW